MGRQPGATGYVQWPEGIDGWGDTGEGGMWVAAFWLCDFSIEDIQPMFDPIGDGLTDAERAQMMTYRRDPFIRCHGPESTIALPLPDAVASGEQADRIYREPPEPLPAQGHSRIEVEQHIYDTLDSAHPVLAAVILGTSGTCWADNEGNPWQATTANLTSRGRALVVALNALYDREAVLVTYLDT